MTYRLASPAVMSLWLSLRGLATERLPEVERLRDEYSGDDADELARSELREMMKRGAVVLVDVRPTMEFEHGHIEGAVSIPLERLEQCLEELPRDKRIVAYCRGEYCLFADEAVSLLRKRGFDAVRLEGGWPEWALERSKFRGTKRRQRKISSEEGARRG